MSQQLNLFNPVFLRQKKIFSARTMLRGMGIVLLAFVAVHAMQRYQLSRLENQLAGAEEQFQNAQRQLGQFATQMKRTPSKALEDEEVRLAAQVKAREKLIEGLEKGELGNAEGFSPYLTALARQTVSGVWLTGFAASGSKGPRMIRGRMLRPELLPPYLRMLNREDALRGHGFEQLKLSTREAKPAEGAAEMPPRYVEFTLGETKQWTGKK